jgi:hypothetical protein
MQVQGPAPVPRQALKDYVVALVVLGALTGNAPYMSSATLQPRSLTACSAAHLMAVLRAMLLWGDLGAVANRCDRLGATVRRCWGDVDFCQKGPLTAAGVVSI